LEAILLAMVTIATVSGVAQCTGLHLVVIDDEVEA
jgi:hypothetical protein